MDKERFLNYMKQQFTPMDSHFTYDLVENVVNYAIQDKNNSEGQLVTFLCEMIPEIKEDEILPFVW